MFVDDFPLRSRSTLGGRRTARERRETTDRVLDTVNNWFRVPIRVRVLIVAKDCLIRMILRQKCRT